MNQQQRDELRAKVKHDMEYHNKSRHDNGLAPTPNDEDYCDDCYVPWPCLYAEYLQDIIRVLDAWEAERPLFYMACGYISAQPEWSDKHPEDVVKFFRGAEATTDPLSQPERTNGPVSPAQTECNHIKGVETAAGSIVTFAYCPKCGEKL